MYDIRVYPFAPMLVRLVGLSLFKSPPVSFGKNLIHAKNPAQSKTNIAISSTGASAIPGPSLGTAKLPNQVVKKKDREESDQVDPIVNTTTIFHCCKTSFSCPIFTHAVLVALNTGPANV